MYDAADRRFMAVDPYDIIKTTPLHDFIIIMFLPNHYLYCNNDPLNCIDHLGLIPSKEAAAKMADHIYKDIHT